MPHAGRAFVVNPASGGGRTADRWRQVVADLERRGDARSLRVAVTARRSGAIDLTRALVEEGFRRFVVMGGDGTIGEVVAGCALADGSGMAAPDIELAIVHAGTGGDVVRGLGIPRDEAGAIETAVSGTPRRLDVGMARFIPTDGVRGDVREGAPLEHRAFLSTANVGVSADVVRRADGALKQLGRSGAFAVATVAGLARNDPREVCFSLDGGEAEHRSLVDLAICNNRFLGGGMQMAPDAAFDDGLFDVVSITWARRMRLLRAFPKIYSGRHITDPLVRVDRATSVDVETPDGAPLQRVVLDGELVGTTPARFGVLPRAIDVLVPQS